MRPASEGDLGAVLQLLRDDKLGTARETDSLQPYEAAFAKILHDPNAAILLATLDSDVIGCAQVNILANISLKATTRAQIEGVRIASRHRSAGYGADFLNLLEGYCRARGCGLMQLTTNTQREDALRFYTAHGFEKSHYGLKKAL